MTSHATTAALKPAFMKAFKLIGSVKPAAEQVGVNVFTAYDWVRKAGLKTSRLPHPAAEKFFKLRAKGIPRKEAARRVGVSYQAAYRWDNGIKKLGIGTVYPDGRVTPVPPKPLFSGTIRIVQRPHGDIIPIPEQVSPRFLSLTERELIADLYRTGTTLTAIGERLGRHKSTVKREIDRYGVNGEYHAYHAHHRAAENRSRPKTLKLSTNKELRDVVEDGLRQHYSPEQISGRLRVDYPDDASMRVSHETIYQSVFVQARGGLKEEMKSALRSGKTRRKPRRETGERQPRFKDDMVMINERPAEVEDRSVPGHWEGDLIMGAGNKSAIGTLVERQNGFTMLLHLPDDHAAPTVRDAIVKKMLTLPESVRASLTWDQGVEMAEHVAVKMATNMDVYFCDPHSPWQRGTNENTNGLLRQYFAKGTDLSKYGPEDLEYVENELNGRPRKRLGWHTPAEHMRELIGS